jgi:dTDP-4-dehydrorhamnose 3,5-epimerase
MHFRECDVSGAWVIDPALHRDERGWFGRAWCSREFADQGISFTPVQANMGHSLRKGTIRGLHYQVAPALEAKLVRCTAGAVFDVVADLRPDSATFMRWYGTDLSASNGRMLYVPEGCAHGCQSTEDDSVILYMTSAFYSPREVRGVRYDDPAFAIRWPLPASSVSEQDRGWPLLRSS